MRIAQLPPPFDEVDRTIVEELVADGRVSIPELAGRARVSRATAYARFARLVDGGVISAFRAVVAPRQRGLHLAALVLIRADQTEWADTLDRLRAIPGVEWVGLAAAAFDFVALVRAVDLTELRDVVLDGLRQVPGLTSTETVIVLDETGSLA